MKPLHKVALAMGLSVLGAPLALSGLIRLGWRRHGADPMNPGFLHPSWVVQPTLPFWSSHLLNLGSLLAGVICLSTAVLLLASLLVARVRSRDQS
jgi:hypothetical protein